MRGQVGGWLYIACGRTGGLGSDETRVRRVGRVGLDGDQTGREQGRTRGGNGVGLRGNGVGLGGTGSDWREQGRTGGERGRTKRERSRTGVSTTDSTVGL